MGHLKVLSQHWSRGNEENNEKVTTVSNLTFEMGSDEIKVYSTAITSTSSARGFWFNFKKTFRMHTVSIKIFLK
jgi:hypothetical protein